MLFVNKHKRMKLAAFEYARSVDICKFSNVELCAIHSQLNLTGWDSRLGPIPDWHGNKFDFFYSCALMERIADKVGDKAIARWKCINALGLNEQDFELWYEKKVQKAALRCRD